MTTLFKSARAAAMTTAMTTALAAAGLVAFAPAPAVHAAGLIAERAEAVLQSDLRVRITGLANSNGEVRIAVYADEAGYGADEAVREAVVSANRSGVAAMFEDLPLGTYAVIAFHDANANAELDRNFVGMPTERYGFSGGAAPRMRQARWDEAAFEHTGAQTVAIALIGPGQ